MKHDSNRRTVTAPIDSPTRRGLRRRQRILVVLSFAVAITLACAAPSVAQFLPPDVDLVLVAEVKDAGPWLGLYEEVLGSPRDLPKPLGVSVAARTGGSRSVNIYKPRFTVQIQPLAGRQAVMVVISGKIAGAEAVRTLPAFQHAVLEIQRGAVENHLTMFYGLSAVSASIMELRLDRP